MRDNTIHAHYYYGVKAKRAHPDISDGVEMIQARTKLTACKLVMDNPTYVMTFLSSRNSPKPHVCGRTRFVENSGSQVDSRARGRIAIYSTTTGDTYTHIRVPERSQQSDSSCHCTVDNPMSPTEPWQRVSLTLYPKPQGNVDSEV